MSKELELIAEALLGAWETPQDVAAHVVSKLSEHGYSIVHLPEPAAEHTLTSGQSYRTFPVWAASSPVIAWSDGDVSLDEHVGDVGTAEARELGLALLAAAAAAEDTND